MRDANQKPDANTDRRPQNQVDEDKGAIKGPQVTEDQLDDRRRDLPAGAQGDRRRAGKGAR